MNLQIISNQEYWLHMHRSLYYYYIAAATTAIAGILHLIWGSNIIHWVAGPPTFGVFFMVSGIAQLFWALPMVKQWGRVWYYIGIAGTVVLVILYAVAREATNEIAIAIIVFETAYIVITGIMLGKERRMKVSHKEHLR